ncbi:hypothetical protein O53_2855 [Microcystis aeruginosa TAIHU98]|uniref:Uncharacterized protein n=1 Tax=Microcystis aeruginosa TAIHU98 TaxID=1134457 RepID=L7E6Y0_MICAE|nr:hypothetical protein O53_2855 [Microcystis aeruginosa TAIHU98]
MLNKRNYNLIDFDRATIQRNRLDFSKKQMRENYRSITRTFSLSVKIGRFAYSCYS